MAQSQVQQTPERIRECLEHQKEQIERYELEDPARADVHRKKLAILEQLEPSPDVREDPSGAPEPPSDGGAALRAALQRSINEAQEASEDRDEQS